MTERISYFDFLRGIAILMVIGIHTYTVRPFDGFENVLLIGVREALNFAVPLFLAISGFFIGKKTIEDKQNYVAFIKKQVPRVYLPMLVWSFPVVLLWIYKGQNILLAVGKSMAGMAFGPYYFIPLIFQLYLLHPIIKKLALKPILGGGILLIINAISVLLLIYVFGKKSLPIVLAVGPFIYWVIFYFIGVYLSDNKRGYSLWVSVVFIVVGFVVQMCESKYLMLIGQVGVGLKLSSWTYAAGMVLLLFSSKMEKVLSSDNAIFRTIVKIGEFSFGIYLAHVYVLLFRNSFPMNESWPVSFILVAVLTTALVMVLRKILPENLWRIVGIK